MARHLPVWTIRFDENDQIINTEKGPADAYHAPHAYVEWNTGITVVTVSAIAAARAHHFAKEALAEYAQERRDRLEVTRRTVAA